MGVPLGLPTDKSVNEVFLYHGTNPFAAKQIATNGFNCKKFCARTTGNGYGPLGRATYFTDDLPKAGTFSMCALCGLDRCFCKTSEGILIPKAVIVCKVTLGKIRPVIKKTTELSHLTEIQKHHSLMGIGKKYIKESEFKSNEFAVYDDSQVCPQYVIYYNSYKNVLNYTIWKSQAKKINAWAEGSELNQLILEYDSLKKQPDKNESKQMVILQKIIHLAQLQHDRTTSLTEKNLLNTLILQANHYHRVFADRLPPPPKVSLDTLDRDTEKHSEDSKKITTDLHYVKMASPEPTRTQEQKGQGKSDKDEVAADTDSGLVKTPLQTSSSLKR